MNRQKTLIKAIKNGGSAPTDFSGAAGGELGLITHATHRGSLTRSSSFSLLPQW